MSGENMDPSGPAQVPTPSPIQDALDQDMDKIIDDAANNQAIDQAISNAQDDVHLAMQRVAEKTLGYGHGEMPTVPWKPVDGIPRYGGAVQHDPWVPTNVDEA